MIIILVRTIILYVLVLFIIRIMGKAELAAMEPFQLVVTLMIAELAALPMENSGVSLFNGITALVTLLFIQVLISFISLKSETVRLLICGRPSVLVEKGKINEKELKKLRINVNDLIEQLRLKNFSSIADVEYAILEANGDLSIIPTAEKRPLTVSDLNLITPSVKNIPLPLIVDGYLYRDSLINLNKDEKWLHNELMKSEIRNYKDVLFCYLDENAQFHLYRKNKENEEKPQ